MSKCHFADYVPFCCFEKLLGSFFLIHTFGQPVSGAELVLTSVVVVVGEPAPGVYKTLPSALSVCLTGRRDSLHLTLNGKRRSISERLKCMNDEERKGNFEMDTIICTNQKGPF